MPHFTDELIDDEGVGAFKGLLIGCAFGALCWALAIGLFLL